MADKKLPIKDATRAELFDFVSLTLGIPVQQGVSRQELVQHVNMTCDEPDYIIVIGDDEDDGPVMGTIAPRLANPSEMKSRLHAEREGRESQNERRGKILINNGTKLNGGNKDVPVSVNGVQILLPRGKKIVVKERYIEALNNAVETHYEQDAKTGEMIENQVHSYPFQFMGWQDEVAGKDGAA